MIDQTMPSTTSQLNRPSHLRLPLQAAPIDRSLSRASAVSGGAGVEADGWWDDLIGGAKDVIGLGSSLAPLFMSNRALKRDITAVRWSR